MMRAGLQTQASITTTCFLLMVVCQLIVYCSASLKYVKMQKVLSPYIAKVNNKSVTYGTSELSRMTFSITGPAPRDAGCLMTYPPPLTLSVAITSSE